MIKRILFRLVVTAVVATVFVLASCERDIEVLKPAAYPTDPEVFLDGFSSGLNYAAFGSSRVDAFDVDLVEKYKGSKSMKIAVPNFADPNGAYAGGAFFTTIGRDLSGYDALTFYAKASKGATLDVVGFGNDMTGASRFVAQRAGLVLNTNWEKFIIPIPNASKLTAERGMFFYSEGPENNLGYTIWFDEVQFEKLGTVAHPRPVILNQQDQNIDAKVGEKLNLGGTFVTFNLSDGTDCKVDAAPGYFTFLSSDEAVATVGTDGVIRAVGLGRATITAKLGSVDAMGSLTVSVLEAPPAPTVPAPTPTTPPDKVISLFSNAYTNVAVDTWSADWDQADVTDMQIAGDDVKLYTKLTYAGIEFTSRLINATAMTHLHLDFWTPDAVNGSTFGIKLVDFGANGAYGGGDDAEFELTLNESSTPALATSSWLGFDIPLSSFTGLTRRGHLAQLIISGNQNLNTVYLDNIYLYNGGSVLTGPTEAAPTPTVPASKVVSLFSNVYNNVAVDTWSASWDNADVAEVQIAGDDARLYTNFIFAGIEFTSQTVDASAMTHFHMDIWTPDATAAPVVFKIKLVDFGANGVWAGGDDVEHELTFNDASTPALANGKWVSFDIPFSDFSGLTTTGHLAQLILSGDIKTVYVDNIYFYNSGTSTEPTIPAPVPTFSAGNVISLFSNAYTNVAVDTWSAGWDQADVADVQVAGDDVKLYTNIVFAGIEFTSHTIDASAMTHFHMDIWTPDATAAPAAFRIKLVDFGADGAWSGGNDVEHELTFNDASIPALASGKWVSFDLPLSSFTGLITKAHLAQLIISGDPKTMYVDNILLHK